jgi:hypothetical protein
MLPPPNAFIWHPAYVKCVPEAAQLEAGPRTQKDRGGTLLLVGGPPPNAFKEKEGACSRESASGVPEIVNPYIRHLFFGRVSGAGGRCNGRTKANIAVGGIISRISMSPTRPSNRYRSPI